MTEVMRLLHERDREREREQGKEMVGTVFCCISSIVAEVCCYSLSQLPLPDVCVEPKIANKLHADDQTVSFVYILKLTGLSQGRVTTPCPTVL